MAGDIHLVEDVAAQVGDGAVHLRPAHIHAQDQVSIGVELQQGATTTAAPFGATMQADEAFVDQPVHDAHDGGQADVQPGGDGAAGDGALPADDLQDG